MLSCGADADADADADGHDKGNKLFLIRCTGAQGLQAWGDGSLQDARKPTTTM